MQREAVILYSGIEGNTGVYKDVKNICDQNPEQGQKTAERKQCHDQRNVPAAQRTHGKIPHAGNRKNIFDQKTSGNQPGQQSSQKRNHDHQNIPERMRKNNIKIRFVSFKKLI